MNKTLKTILSVVLAAAICCITYFIYDSIMQPVRFNKDEKARESVAIQQLKDIRDLQVAYKSVHSKFTSSFDTLKQFYREGQMAVLMQVGSNDDSLAVAHTNAVRKANRGIKDEDLYKMFKAGDMNLVFSVEHKINVRDTLFKNRPDFNIDGIDRIPFSESGMVEMSSVVKKVSGVDVPLFEAKIPFKALLEGLDNQLRINMDAERRDQGRYEGLQVGSISAPNNHAGNWE